ncbi:MAG TPA: protein kinase [Gemmataceae bacterium]|nr:protein kinase [Gemmataceae bacterium]
MGVVGGLLASDPAQIGPYRLLDVLGSGGFGRVFLGRSPEGRFAAVKVIRPELAADPEFRARFRREVAAARKVSGRFTAQVIDADAEGPVPWLATEYVSGPSLAKAVAMHGPLPVGSVLALAAGLMEALAAIHAAGLVHRDLKPDNVLLAEDGPRVIDFGIARAAGASTLTGTGMLIGTLAFMSPEQVRAGEVGPPSDVFSLGSVLVFAATGEGPFGTGPTAHVLYRVAHDTPSLDRVPQEIRPLIQHCLAPEPGRRPTPGDLLAELRPAKPTVGWLPAAVTRDVQPIHYAGAPAYLGPAGAAGAAAALSAAARTGAPESPNGYRRNPGPAGNNSRSPLGRKRLVKIGSVVTAVVVAVTLGAIYASGHLIRHTPAPGADPATQGPVHQASTQLPSTHQPSTHPPSTQAPSTHAAPNPGQSSKTATSSGVSSATWSAGTHVSSGAALVSVSCPAAGFCLAADSAGNVYTRSGGTWSQPHALGGGGLTSVSCATSSFCAATSRSDGVFTYSGGTWSAPSQLVAADGAAANPTWVSCPAAGTCVATGRWDTYTYSGGRWAQGHLLQNTNFLVSISCPSASFCVAADNGGNVYTYSSGAWSQAHQLGGGALTSVSCATSSFCAATSTGDEAFTYSNGGWSAPSQLVGADGAAANLTSVSCPAAGMCIATGRWDTYTYSGGRWAQGHLVENTAFLMSVSCASASFCIAADNAGNIYTY